jgi:hypothetical protein
LRLKAKEIADYRGHPDEIAEAASHGVNSMTVGLNNKEKKSS